MTDSKDNEDYCGFDDPMGLIYTEFTSWNTDMIQFAHKRVDTIEETVKTQESNIEELQETVKSQQETIDKQNKIIEALCNQVGIDPASF